MQRNFIQRYGSLFIILLVVVVLLLEAVLPLAFKAAPLLILVLGGIALKNRPKADSLKSRNLDGSEMAPSNQERSEFVISKVEQTWRESMVTPPTLGPTRALLVGLAGLLQPLENVQKITSIYVLKQNNIAYPRTRYARRPLVLLSDLRLYLLMPTQHGGDSESVVPGYSSLTFDRSDIEVSVLKKNCYTISLSSDLAISIKVDPFIAPFIRRKSLAFYRFVVDWARS